MENDKDFEALKKEYLETPISKELDQVVQKAIDTRKQKRKRNWIKYTTGLAAGFIFLVNINPTFADTLSQLPVVGGIIKAIDFRQYQMEGESYSANINVPQIEGLKDEKLQKEINQNIQEDADQTYQEFLEMLEKWKRMDTKGNYSVAIDYKVLTNTEEIFAMRIDKQEIEASSNQQSKYYVVDKEKEKLLTLQELFKDDTYIEVINQYLIEEMTRIMKVDRSKVYWMPDDEYVPFKGIEENQKFYINESGKIVIHFDQYEAGPGGTGESDFVIPTEKIKDLLTDNRIVK